MQGHLGAALLPRIDGRPSAGMTDSRTAGINAKSRHWHEALNFPQYLASPRSSIRAS
jgi:hypothetical protein